VARIDELRQMTKIASLYYEAGLNQPEIAARLDLSQSRVSRLLKQALDEGIVVITVRAPVGTHPDLEERLGAVFGLRDVVVVDVGADSSEEQTARELGSAAAYYLESTVRTGDVIGISSWSATLLAMVQAMHPVTTVRDTRVIQILGGVGDPAAAGHATQLIQQLAHLVHGSAAFLPAPGVVGSAEARRFLLEDPYILDVVALFDQVTVALVGIGALEPSGLLAKSGNVFSVEERAAVAAAGAVGDLVLRFVAADGSPVASPLDERVIGISLAQLGQVARSVGVAGGARKTAAIRGAILGGWVNCLITDVWTAERLLAPSEASEGP
jgi:DNA-binding transcriptional regulator LsrR (DeoR family)